VTPLRRFFGKLLLLGTFILAALALAVIVTTIRSVQRAGQDFDGNLYFHVAQLEHEIMQLQDRVDAFSEARPTVDLATLTLRFDILWSRVFADSIHSTTQNTIDFAKTVNETTNTARGILKEIEPLFDGLQPGPSVAIDTIQSELRGLLEIAHQLSTTGRNHRIQVEALEMENRLRQTYLIFGLIIGMLVFGILSILLLRADRQEIRRMNTELEDRVLERTTDLQSANARLAAEIAERESDQHVATERETRLDQAARLAKLGYYVWDAIEDVCEYCSDQHAAAHGLTTEEYIAAASKLDGEFGLTHPDDREAVKQKYQDLRAGKLIEMEYRVNTPGGIRRLHEVARPIFDDQGTVVREVGSTIDVTEQHDTEMKLFEAQRMDSIGKMTGGVAHDFNNLLAVILGNLELMREIPDSLERDEMINDAMNATLRGRDLTMSMLSFARRAPHDPSELNLNTVISGMERMLRRTMPENIMIDINLTADIWTVMADRSLTESALLNLAINARDAIENGGKLKIGTANVNLSPEDIQIHDEEIEPGNYVMMSVADTGRGIPPETLEKIFEPFFTTKAITNNSGLGLSMVHGFIRQTGGTIRVTSKTGIGTTFRLFFKSSAIVDSSTDTAAAPVSEQKKRDLRVLLVEDDNTVRKVLTRQLEKFGMTVVPAAESTSAERAFKTEPNFDIVVSDIVMPGDLQGPALVRRLREFEPDLPAVFLSGYPREANVHGSDDTSHDIMLMKPVSREDLLTAIDSAVRD